MRLGDQVLDLSALHAGMLNDWLDGGRLGSACAQPLMKLGKPVTVALRQRLQALMATDCAELRDHRPPRILPCPSLRCH